MGHFFGFFHKDLNSQSPHLQDFPLLFKDEYFLLFGECGFDVVIKETKHLVILLHGFVYVPIGAKSEIAMLSYLEQLYTENRENFHEQIIGNYTICIYDKRHKNLRIIKDHMGTRPIYFVDKKNFFAFSSDLNCLVDANLVELKLNYKKLIDFLSLEIGQINTTFFDQIKKLRPSEILTIDKQSRLYEYDYKGKLGDESAGRPIQDFKDHFENAVKRSLHRKNNLGLLLSGGLDSSAVATGLYNLGIKDVQTFSANYLHLPEGLKNKTDETKYQMMVSEKFGYKHTCISVENISPFESLKLQSKYFAEPTFFPNLYIFDQLAKTASRENISIMYDGQDGDTTISHGLERIFELYQRKNIFLLIYEVIAYSFFNKVKVFNVIQFFLTQFLKKTGAKRFQSENKSLIRNRIYSQGDNRISAFDTHLEKILNPLRSVALEINYQFFRYYNIHTRSPFYDLLLTKYCCALSSKWKLRHGRGRFILREYLRENLSKFIADRPGKANLSHGIIFNIGTKDIDLIKTEVDQIHPAIEKIIDMNKLRAYVSCLNEKNNVTDSMVSALVAFYVANRWLNAQAFGQIGKQG